MPSLRSLLLLALAACPLALPAVAGAEVPGQKIHRSFSVEVRLPRQNGYSLKISTRGQRQVSIVADRRGTHITYNVEGRVSRDRIAADFGRFGRVDVRFRGGPWRTEKGFGKCAGRKPVTRRGSVRGAIRVRGGRGFVDLSVRRARATMTRVLPLSCPYSVTPPARPAAMAGLATIGPSADRRGGAGSKEQEEEFALLTVGSHDRGRRVTFLAFEFFGAPFLAGVGVRDRVGRVGVTEGAIVVEPSGVKFGKPSDEAERAAVTLPPPFAGKATYTREGNGQPSWTGSLRVRLPGSGVVPLTGTGFHPRLCRPGTQHELQACLSTLATPRLSVIE